VSFSAPAVEADAGTLDQFVQHEYFYLLNKWIPEGGFQLETATSFLPGGFCLESRAGGLPRKEEEMHFKSYLLLQPMNVCAMLVLCLLSLQMPLVAQNTGNGDQMNSVGRSSVERLTSSWPEKPREAARKLVAKYGPPNEANDDMLVWKNNGPWKRTILYKQEIPHEFPEHHTDFLQQVIDYRVPADKFDDLAKFDGSVIVERTKGEMSARCDMEELNMLAVNLANDVITGKHSVDDARTDYAKTAMEFKKGNPQPYTQQLQFQVANGVTADPDKPASQKMASTK
jgi:hypothetical protein